MDASTGVLCPPRLLRAEGEQAVAADEADEVSAAQCPRSGLFTVADSVRWKRAVRASRGGSQCRVRHVSPARPVPLPLKQLDYSCPCPTLVLCQRCQQSKHPTPAQPAPRCTAPLSCFQRDERQRPPSAPSVLSNRHHPGHARHQGSCFRAYTRVQFRLYSWSPLKVCTGT